MKTLSISDINRFILNRGNKGFNSHIISVPGTSLLVTTVLMLVGEGATPELAPDYDEQLAEMEPLLDAFEGYRGYAELLKQTDAETTMEVVRLIETSQYPDLVRAIIEVESNWNIRALSHKDARGLMQIRDIAAREIVPTIDPDALYDPILNVRIGIEIFEDHMNYFENYNHSEHWALTSYNRGRYGTFSLQATPPRTSYSNNVLNRTMSL